MNATHDTTKRAGMLHDDELDLPTELRDLTEHVASFITAVDIAIGDQIVGTKHRMYWSLANKLIGEGTSSGMLGGCFFGLRALERQPDLLVQVPRLLREQMRGHVPMESLLMSDNVLVFLLPALVAYLRTVEGSDFYERVQHEVQNIGGDDATP